MSPEPPRGDRQDGQQDGPQRRPLTRGDLFGPEGSLGPGRAPQEAPRERSPWEPPAEQPADPTEAYEPGQYQPRPAGDYAPGPYEPGQYQVGPDNPFENSGYRPGQYQPTEQFNPGLAAQASIPQGSAPGHGDYDGGYPQGYGQEGYGFPQGPQREQWYGNEPPPGGGGRGRNVLLAALLVIAVAIVAGGVAYALAGGRDDDDGAGQAAVPSVSAEPSAPETSEPAQQPSESATPEPTDPADYDGIPSQPWRDKSLDFGYLVSVKQSGDEIRLEVNRATYLTGDKATEANGGEPPENDYFIEDTNPKLRTFVLDANAAVEGTSRLGGGDADRQRLTVEEFVDQAQEELGTGADDEGVPVWLRHASGDQDGPVTALAEQYVP